VVIQSKSLSASYGVFTEVACAVKAPLMKISVSPSGVALATRLAPITPPASGDSRTKCLVNAQGLSQLAQLLGKKFLQVLVISAAVFFLHGQDLHTGAHVVAVADFDLAFDNPAGGQLQPQTGGLPTLE
jgi:hypothetical protein